MTNTELTRAEIAAWCEAAWARYNAQLAARGEPDDRYVITQIGRALEGGVPLYQVQFRAYYQQLDTEQCVCLTYILQQSPHTGTLQFVLWESMEEESKEES